MVISIILTKKRNIIYFYYITTNFHYVNSNFGSDHNESKSKKQAVITYSTVITVGET